VIFADCKNSRGTNQDWDIGAEGQIQSLTMSKYCLSFGQPARVYTNGDTVDLTLNEIFWGSQTVAEFDSAFFLLPGNIKNVTVVVQKDKKTWSKDSELIGTKEVGLTLDIERPVEIGEPIYSDGQDVAMLRASVLDEDGRLVRTATDALTFTIVSGPGKVLGTGNGSPSNHSPDQGNKCPLFNGFVRDIIGTLVSSVPGSIVVEVSATGLHSARVEIPTRPMNVTFI